MAKLALFRLNFGDRSQNSRDSTHLYKPLSILRESTRLVLKKKILLTNIYSSDSSEAINQLIPSCQVLARQVL